MLSNTTIFTVKNFDFRLQHLLIIGILIISFSISFMIRAQPADYGFELNEFDPFFNFRATQFIVDNGISDYFEWNDDKSWYPTGRDVSSNSQVMLHITAAILYNVFGGDSSLYDFTILFPVVIGSLTTIVIFALVRVIGGTTAGLFASLFFAVSVPVIVRGSLGWFKSEPLGLFYGLLGIYLFLSAIKSNNKKIAIAKLIGGGIVLAFGLSAWGGVQFFILPLGLFFLALPIIRRDHSFLIWAIPLFTGTLLLSTMLFERPSINFVTGIGTVILILPTIYLIVSIIIQKISKEGKKLRNGFGFLAATIIAGISMLSLIGSQIFGSISFRYLNAINPFLTTTDPLVDSVAEHATTTAAQSFYFLSILMVFAGLGVWLIFRSREKLDEYNLKISSEMIVFALLIGILGVYVSSAFVRLELFASVAIIILSSLGLSIITSEIFRTRKIKSTIKQTRGFIKVSFVVIIIALLLIPTTIPAQGNWINGTKAPPTILNGGSRFNVATTDWLDAMDWLKNNTPKDSVVASWWDYGYWISTLGERASLADNATVQTLTIQKIAKILLGEPDEAWRQLNDWGADYVLVFIAAQKIQNNPQPLYILSGGGDESKKQWFMRIAEEPLGKYVQADGLSGTPHFWQNTLLGQLTPFELLGYVNVNTNQQTTDYFPGGTGVYDKSIKYPSDGNGPFKLVYSSQSFDRADVGPIIGVFIYEINKNYQPNVSNTENNQVQSTPSTTSSEKELATISTPHGDIMIEFKEDVAPKTVENFKKLAKEGFYDGTIFHRIIPGFVIQGGDPNTISGPRDSWGKGGPPYSIEPEFSTLKHEKYIVSMARGADINSAGSQFYIMLGSASWLDGQYTIFGEVVSGHQAVDAIGSLETNEKDQPIEPSQAIMNKVTIGN